MVVLPIDMRTNSNGSQSLKDKIWIPQKTVKEIILAFQFIDDTVINRMSLPYMSTLNMSKDSMLNGLLRRLSW